MVDTTREFEKKIGVGEISLRNIHQAVIITPSGNVQRVRSDDMAAAVKRAVAGASWRVDPANIPDELKRAWRSVEFGDYASAARDLIKQRGSLNGELKQAAEALYAVVDVDLKKDGRRAWDLGQDKKFFEAYVAMTEFKERFKGYELPKKLLDAHAWLEKKEEVRNEIRAAGLVSQARPLLNSPRDTVRNRGVSKLRNLVKRFAGTKAAAEAQKLLDSLPGAG